MHASAQMAFSIFNNPGSSAEGMVPPTVQSGQPFGDAPAIKSLITALFPGDARLGQFEN